MNTYHKSQYPNVFYAKCDSRKIKGEIINVTTKYGKENECEVFNLIFEKDGFYYYSIIRADGTNTQTRAAAKAARYAGWANAAENKSNQYYEASQEGKDFLSLAEPIKVGHHSEKHTDLKNNPAKRSHSFSLTYAKKDLNNAEKNLEAAKKLWS